MPKIPAKFHPPLYVLTFGLITSMVVLGITTLWYRSNPPVAYTVDNLIRETEAETEVVIVEPSLEQETAEVVPPPNLAANQAVQASQEEQAVAAGPAEEVAAPTSTPTPDLYNMQHPIEGHISPGFEFIYSETYQDFRLHPAFDYSAPEGSKVLAVMEGVVGKIEPSPEGGYIVTLKHGDGWETSYTAVDTELKENQYVAQGTLLGYLVGLVPGETANGSHLHFELRKDGNAVDPGEYLQ